MRVIILGAGGQGTIVANALLRAREAGAKVDPIGFVDDLHSGEVAGLPILGVLASLRAIAHEGVVVAIGDNGTRRELCEQLVARGERLVTALHPWTSIAPDVTIGAGSMISAGAIVTSRATIGRAVLLNTKASIDHDSVVGDFVHISLGATIGAKVVIGEQAMIGIGASVLSGCRIGARSVIGAGTLVVEDIPDGVVAYGVPARVKRRL